MSSSYPLLCALCCTLCGAAVSAEPFKDVRPERAGMSKERLDRIGALVNKAVEDHQTAGGVALVARQGKIVYFEAFGSQDSASGVPMQKDSIFRIYSMSKPITSVAVMMLYEEGKFRLRDPLSKYLPEFGHSKVAKEETDAETGEKKLTLVDPVRPIQIRDLLRHTAGIPYVPTNPELAKLYMEADLFNADKYDLEAAIKRLAELPLSTQPGTMMEYGFSTDVLGRLVEVWSGMPFDQFLQQRLFGPLGMVDTGFFVPSAKADRLATLYRLDNTTGAIVPVSSQESLLKNDYFSRPSLLSGGGGMVGTAMDYLRFSQMLLNGGELDGVRILSPKTIELMTQNHLEDVPESLLPGLRFGLGFFVTDKLGRAGEIGSEGSYGWGGAAQTRFVIDPKEDLICIFMVQTYADDYPLSDKISQLAYQAVVESKMR